MQIKRWISSSMPMDEVSQWHYLLIFAPWSLSFSFSVTTIGTITPRHLLTTHILVQWIRTLNRIFSIIISFQFFNKEKLKFSFKSRSAVIHFIFCDVVTFFTTLILLYLHSFAECLLVQQQLLDWNATYFFSDSSITSLIFCLLLKYLVTHSLLKF